MVLAVSGTATAQDISVKFRGAKAQDLEIRFDGRDAREYVKLEPEGMRWKYTKDNAPKSPVGLIWRMDFPDDFTVTAQYEILDVKAPDRGSGVGPELYLMFPTDEKDAIPFARVVNSAGNAHIMYHHMHGADKERVAKDSRRPPTTDKSLRGALRIVREGKTLIAFLAEGDDPFVEIDRRPFIDAPLRTVRFSGVVGGATQAELDMRLLEINIQTGRPGAANAPVPVAPVVKTGPVEGERSNSSLWLLAGIAVLALALFVILGLILFVVRRNASAAAEPAPSESHGAEDNGSTVTLTCDSCGKKLKVRDDAAGKRVKCPGCGEAMVVPT
jgi:ribosomal protein S27E